MFHHEHKRLAFLKRIYSSLGTDQGWLGQTQDGSERTPENFTMLQAFEWYCPDDKRHWQRLRQAIPHLKETGVDNIWIPPACKASGPSGNGYDVYDLYDLGEFDTKGSVGTKWGTKDDLLKLCHDAKQHGVGIYFDAVLNHKAAADTKEKCRAVRVDQNNRLQEIGEPFEIEAWLGFDFAARSNRYSRQKYHWYHFTGTDYNAAGNGGNGENGIFRILGDGKKFATDVDTENGNYDYLMFADLDYSHPEVREDVKAWGCWVAKELGLKGFRFDAIKHFSEEFLLEFIKHLDEQLGEGWFLVGEFWKTTLPDLQNYLRKMEHKFSLFDAPLVERFHEIACGDKADLRTVFDNTLVQSEPWNAVTLVQNHDTQPSQALQLDIPGWFKPLAYSLILLRESGYPCLFYGDLYGLKGGCENNWQGPMTSLPNITLARKLYAYGEQNDYFNEPNLIGWVRRGTWDRPAGCAVVLSNANMGEIRMFVGEMHKGEIWTDVLGWSDRRVEIGNDGFGLFCAGACSAGIFVNANAKGRDRFGRFDAKLYDHDR